VVPPTTCRIDEWLIAGQPVTLCDHKTNEKAQYTYILHICEYLKYYINMWIGVSNFDS
jgi:hypothetical protein